MERTDSVAGAARIASARAAAQRLPGSTNQHQRTRRNLRIRRLLWVLWVLRCQLAVSGESMAAAYPPPAARNRSSKSTIRITSPSTSACVATFFFPTYVPIFEPRSFT